jgi:dienelactone hydrolase
LAVDISNHNNDEVKKMNHKIRLLLVMVLGVLGSHVQAAVLEQAVPYEYNGTSYTGYIYFDDALKGKQPGVLVIHEWWGLNDYAKGRAKELASMGYVAFAMDMYGDNKVTNHPAQAKEWMKQTTANVDEWQKRANLGLKLLRENQRVQDSKVAAVGYCFGGATVMQLAYSGADVTGVVSFHGSLPPANAEQAKAIKGKVLVEHGNDDAFIPAERVVKFKAALNDAGVDYTFHGYDGVRHAFTNPDAGSYGIENLKYDADADSKSWSSMKTFLAGLFAK